MTERKFYRRVFHIEVLSEEPIPGEVDLTEIHYNITEGHCSGRIACDEQEEMDGKKAADLLIDQGSDPEFFNLDEAGDDVEGTYAK